MLFIHIAHIWERTSALAGKLSMRLAYNVLSMDGFSTVKLANAWVKNVFNLDHDKKPVMTKTVQYNDNFGDKDCKSVNWKEGK